MNKYPYYIIPDIEEYNKANGDERRELARKLAVSIGDQAVLRAILGLSPEEFASFYPDMQLPDPTTEETIETFIETFGDPAVRDKDELDMIVMPAAAYNIDELASLPELEETDVELSAIPTLNIKPDSSVTGTVTQNSTQKPTDPETDFKICVKNGDYARALEIITEISLNNPKKSVYFADQMRFLKKLIEIKNN